MKKLLLSALAVAGAFSCYAADVPTELWMMGDIKNNIWKEKNKVSGTSTESGIFTFENITLVSDNATAYFTFTTSNSEDWAVLNGNDGTYVRYGANDVMSVGSPTEIWLGGDVSIQIAPGTYTFTVNLNNDTVTATEGVEQETTYGEYTIYVYNNIPGWNNDEVALYQHGSVNDLGGGWPGRYSSGVTEKDNLQFLTYAYGDVPVGATQYFIFSNAGSNQLGDFEYTFGDETEIYLEISVMGVSQIDPSNFTPVAPSYGSTPSALYLLGDNNGWNPTTSAPFTLVGTGIFQINDVEFTGETCYFTLTNALAESNDDDGWDFINDGQHRYGPAAPSALTSAAASNFYLVKGNSWTIAAGTYSLVVNFNAGTIQIGEYEAPEVEPLEIPEALYLIGNMKDETDWQLTDAVKFSQDGTTEVFSLAGVSLTDSGNGSAYFTLVNIEPTSWEEINSTDHRYGPLGDTATVDFTSGNPITYSEGGSWNVAPGTYDISVDFEKAIMTVSKASTDAIQNIENAIEGEAVYYNLQGVRVNSKNLTPGIYIVNGKKVLVR